MALNRLSPEKVTYATRLENFRSLRRRALPNNRTDRSGWWNWINRGGALGGQMQDPEAALTAARTRLPTDSSTAGGRTTQ
ncbi:MAG: hypothetical protein IPL49_22080 [Saprospirales bacterium]|nr:hypothetical protein [Saprospirales bacterium]